MANRNADLQGRTKAGVRKGCVVDVLVYEKRLFLKMSHKLPITLLAEIWRSMNNYFHAIKCELFLVYLWI